LGFKAGSKIVIPNLEAGELITLLKAYTNIKLII
jgi:hypothetical protein